MKKLISIIVITIMLVGCNGSSMGSGKSVGPYNGSLTGYAKDDAKVMGHRGKDIYNPTPEQVEWECSICHYIY